MSDKKLSLRLSAEELMFLNSFLAKFNIENRSDFVRKSLFSLINSENNKKSTFLDITQIIKFLSDKNNVENVSEQELRQINYSRKMVKNDLKKAKIMLASIKLEGNIDKNSQTENQAPEPVAKGPADLKITIRLTDKEEDLLNNFLAQHNSLKISDLMREAIFSAIQTKNPTANKKVANVCDLSSTLDFLCHINENNKISEKEYQSISSSLKLVDADAEKAKIMLKAIAEKKGFELKAKKSKKANIQKTQNNSREMN